MLHPSPDPALVSTFPEKRVTTPTFPFSPGRSTLGLGQERGRARPAALSAAIHVFTLVMRSIFNWTRKISPARSVLGAAALAAVIAAADPAAGPAAFACPYARPQMSAALAPPLEESAVSALPGGRAAVASPYGSVSLRARQCSHHSHP